MSSSSGTGVVGLPDRGAGSRRRLVGADARGGPSRRSLADRRELPQPSAQHATFSLGCAVSANAWAPHLETRNGSSEQEEYLQLEGPNARAYLQGYVRYAGGATWHWAGICWRITPDDMRLKSLYGVGRDWPFDYDVLEPYYTRAEYAMGVCGPSDPALQWPPNTTLQALSDGTHSFRSRRAAFHRSRGKDRDDQSAGAASPQQRRLLSRPAAMLRQQQLLSRSARSPPSTTRRRRCQRSRPRAARSWPMRSSTASRPARRTRSRPSITSIPTSSRTGSPARSS